MALGSDNRIEGYYCYAKGDNTMNQINYFKCWLNDGRTLDFNHGCNRVAYNNDKVCIFINESSDGELVLAIIPYTSIVSIERDVEVCTI